MTTAVREAPHHNNLTCYTDYRCRLPECVDRYNEWSRARWRAMADGTWQPLLDAEPVRQHLLTLHAAGITIFRVAALTGMSHRSVRAYTQHDYGNKAPRRRRVTREVAERILAIDPEQHTPGNVHPIGSRRRFEALAAIGWPSIHVAKTAGINPSNRTVIFTRTVLRATTAAKITDAYEQLKHQKPERRGIRKGSITTVKIRARENGWPPPSYWDDAGGIDDPDFEPRYGITRLEIVAQDANEVMRFSGLDRQAAADRLGVDKSYIDRAFKVHPQYAVEVAA
ncbi:hypothetical protein ABT215_11235 [Streptomyces sp900105755]|uniref:hypothetical protein n=1 Tax=Streptomyces sp. 900105755 TaxID=3154389 RepID=UPI003332F66F